jgi:serine/threonine-protein kinase
MKALAHDGTARYGSVAEMQRDLRDFLRSAWRLPRVVFAPGSLILREGQNGRDAYVIIQGHCQVFKTIAGRKLVLRQMGPGDVFGETAVFTSQPRSASVEALDEVGALVITREELEHGLGMSHWLTPFVRTLAERFREVDTRRAELEVRSRSDAA